MCNAIDYPILKSNNYSINSKQLNFISEDGIGEIKSKMERVTRYFHKTTSCQTLFVTETQGLVIKNLNIIVTITRSNHNINNSQISLNIPAKRTNYKNNL